MPPGPITITAQSHKKWNRRAVDRVRSSMNLSHLKLTSMLLLLASTLLAQGQAQSSEADKAHILVLGTFHLANHNKDMFNVQADDMLAPKRQAEIAALVESLKAFQPTKIAVEAAVGQPELNQKYQPILGRKIHAYRGRGRPDWLSV